MRPLVEGTVARTGDIAGRDERGLYRKMRSHHGDLGPVPLSLRADADVLDHHHHVMNPIELAKMKPAEDLEDRRWRQAAEEFHEAAAHGSARHALSRDHGRPFDGPDQEPRAAPLPDQADQLSIPDHVAVEQPRPDPNSGPLGPPTEE